MPEHLPICYVRTDHFGGPPTLVCAPDCPVELAKADAEAPLPKDLRDACKTLERESFGDFIYEIREREGRNWDGPRVKAFSAAVDILRRYANSAREADR